MKRKTLLAGAGINDANYLVSYTDANGEKVVCPYYRTWEHMIERCYGKDRHLTNPSYVTCTVTPEWLSFMTFRKWMEKQDWQGKQLDKDLLIPGNKMYGPDVCIFVSGALNTFTTERTAARGEWPIGVSLRKDTGKFKAQCSNPITKRRESLGNYSTPEEAHLAWKKRKHEIACQLAGIQDDARLSKALAKRYRLNDDIV